LTKNLDTTPQGSQHPLDLALDMLPGGTPLELRDRVLFELAARHHLSAEQLVNLDLAAVDESARSLRIATESVELGAPVWHAIDGWLGRGRPVLVHDQTETALFVSRSGRRLSLSDVRRRLNAMTPAEPARKPAERTSISTTRRYLRVESKRLRKAYARAHPRA
jgi:site-specific recombinase XerD